MTAFHVLPPEVSELSHEELEAKARQDAEENVQAFFKMIQDVFPIFRRAIMAVSDSVLLLGRALSLSLALQHLPLPANLSRLNEPMIARLLAHSSSLVTLLGGLIEDQVIEHAASFLRTLQERESQPLSRPRRDSVSGSGITAEYKFQKLHYLVCFGYAFDEEDGQWSPSDSRRIDEPAVFDASNDHPSALVLTPTQRSMLSEETLVSLVSTNRIRSSENRIHEAMELFALATSEASLTPSRDASRSRPPIGPTSVDDAFPEVREAEQIAKKLDDLYRLLSKGFSACVPAHAAKVYLVGMGPEETEMLLSACGDQSEWHRTICKPGRWAIPSFVASSVGRCAKFSHGMF